MLTFLLLFSPFFFLFPGLLALGHVVDSSNAKHIGGKEHVVLIKKRLSQAIYLFVWKLLLHFTDNMKKKHEMKQKIAMQSMERKNDHAVTFSLLASCEAKMTDSKKSIDGLRKL